MNDFNITVDYIFWWPYTQWVYCVLLLVMAYLCFNGHISAIGQQTAESTPTADLSWSSYGKTNQGFYDAQF